MVHQTILVCGDILNDKASIRKRANGGVGMLGRTCCEKAIEQGSCSGLIVTSRRGAQKAWWHLVDKPSKSGKHLARSTSECSSFKPIDVVALLTQFFSIISEV